MYTLGICNGETSSSCLFNDGVLISAASEERFSRIKMDQSFPYKAIDYILSENKLELNDLNQIAYSWKKGFHDSLLETYTKRSSELLKKNEKSYSIFQERINVERLRDSIKENEFWHWAENNLNSKLLRSIYTCYHHEAHAFSASLLSPFNKGVVIEK